MTKNLEQATMYGVQHLINRKRRRQIKAVDKNQQLRGGLPVRYDVRKLNQWTKPEMVAFLPSERGYDQTQYETTIVPLA